MHRVCCISEHLPQTNCKNWTTQLKTKQAHLETLGKEQRTPGQEDVQEGRGKVLPLHHCCPSRAHPRFGSGRSGTALTSKTTFLHDGFSVAGGWVGSPPPFPSVLAPLSALPGQLYSLPSLPVFLSGFLPLVLTAIFAQFPQARFFLNYFKQCLKIQGHGGGLGGF